MTSGEKKDEVICARCGMEKAEWSTPEGVAKDNATYCCSGCAENTGCVCGEESRQELGQRGFGRGAETGGVNPGQQTGTGQRFPDQQTPSSQEGQKGGDYPPHGQRGNYPGRQGGDQPGGQPGGGW